MRGWLLVMGLLVWTAALAQPESPKLTTMADDEGEPLVYCVQSNNRDSVGMAGLDDQISIRVKNFSKLLERANKNCSGIVLFIDGFPIKGLQPVSCDLVSGRVRYHLLRKGDSIATWRSLLGRPANYTRPVSISVGANQDFALPSKVTAFQLEVIPRRGLITFIILSSGCGLAFFWLCRRRGLIRTGSLMPMSRRPYNLALFQMGFWFFLVMVAYLFIWMISDELNTITGSVLILLGIGAGTALSASVIDKNNQPDASLTTPTELGKPLETRGFLNDLLTDASGGYSLYRFQLFIWTLVLGTIFCDSVYRRLEMPQFSEGLLALMGISSGTYLGFKVPEGKAAAPTPNPTSGSKSE